MTGCIGSRGCYFKKHLHLIVLTATNAVYHMEFTASNADRLEKLLRNSHLRLDVSLTERQWQLKAVEKAKRDELMRKRLVAEQRNLYKVTDVKRRDISLKALIVLSISFACVLLLPAKRSLFRRELKETLVPILALAALASLMFYVSWSYSVKYDDKLIGIYAK